MFVDFDQVFFEDEKTKFDLPETVLAYLNKKLPDGVKYEKDEEGRYVIVNEGESCTIGGIHFRPTEEHKKILGENFSFDDLISYFYNAQKPIPLELEKEGYILLNNEEYPISKLVYKPLEPIKYVEGSLYAYPMPFPEPFEITVGCGDYTREIKISRIPNDSISEMAFSTEKDVPLFIEYWVDEKAKKKFKMNMMLNLQCAKSVRDVVEVTTIYNAFMEGNGRLCGELLGTGVENAKLYEKESIIFWKKVLAVEEMLDKSFRLPSENVESDTIILIETLYQTLVKKNPIKDINKIDSINGKWDCIEKIKSSIGQSLTFQFEGSKTAELFGVQIELFAWLFVFNSQIKEIVESEGEQKLILCDESKEKKRYTSVIYFKTESELKEFIECDRGKRLLDFYNAISPYEYLRQNMT